MIINAELSCTVERFPLLREKITSVFNENEEFQGLCYDYFLCMNSLDQWEMLVEKDEKFIREYKELKTTLEKELIQFLSQVEQK